METVVVTRHKGLVVYLQELGLTTPDTPILEHATPDLISGKHVIGVLPLWLAACADQVTEVPINIPVELRGQELSADQMREWAGVPVTYTVRMLA